VYWNPTAARPSGCRPIVVTGAPTTSASSRSSRTTGSRTAADKARHERRPRALLTCGRRRRRAAVCLPCTDAAGESPLEGRPRRAPGPAPSGLGYRPIWVRIRTAVARIVGAVAAKAAHQILAFCFPDIAISLTSSHSRTACPECRGPADERKPVAIVARAGGETAHARADENLHRGGTRFVRWMGRLTYSAAVSFSPALRGRTKPAPSGCRLPTHGA
jgi:hypothetical protein